MKQPTYDKRYMDAVQRIMFLRNSSSMRSGGRNIESSVTGIEENPGKPTDSSSVTTCMLLMNGTPADEEIIRSLLAEKPDFLYTLTAAPSIDTALNEFGKGMVDIVLLKIPRSGGSKLFEWIRTESDIVPVIILVAEKGEDIGVKAVKYGAQDVLIQGCYDGGTLIRTVKYAIIRNNIRAGLASHSLLDELTGLYNRRGFFSLAQQQIKLSKRMNRGFFLLYADLDNFKSFNDTCGHAKGDQVLKAFAEVMTSTFRETDIISRIGGDEFCAVVPYGNDPEMGASINERLHKRLSQFQSGGSHNIPLSASIGVTYYDPENPLPLQELLNRADCLMYEDKRRK